MKPSKNKNSVQNLITYPFSTLTQKEQTEIMKLGRPTPNLADLVVRPLKVYERGMRNYFDMTIYNKHSWLCGCEFIRALFCFPCLCFGNENLWIVSGIKNWDQLPQKIKKHENSLYHLENEVNFKLFGDYCVNDKTDEIEVKRHNEQTEKNLYILKVYLKCLLFCGMYNLPLNNRGFNNTMTSENDKSAFLGAFELCKSSDLRLRCHLEDSTDIDWTSMTYHDELLDCIFLVARQNILSEIEMVEFISIIVDEIIDISSTVHFTLLFRYELYGKPVERFWGVFNAVDGRDVESLTRKILFEINSVLKNAPYKLVAQSYGGATLMNKVSIGIKKLYPYAYIHCHSHQLHVEIIQSISKNKEVQTFFFDLSNINEYFANSLQMVTELEKLTNYRLSRTEFDFTWTGGTLKTVYMYRNEIIQYMDKIIKTSLQTTTINQAASIKRLLSDSVFLLWLSVFYEIMPNIHNLHNNVQIATRDNCADEQIPILVQQFEKQIYNVRNKVADIIDSASKLPNVNVKRKHFDEEYNDLHYNNEFRKKLANDICTTLIDTTKDRLEFTKHLAAVKLFQADKYTNYLTTFPFKLLQCTTSCYPILDEDRLEFELFLIYINDEFYNLSGVIPTYQHILKNNKNNIFKEVSLLLKLLIAIPPITTENENSYSTLKRIKACLENTTNDEEKLNALLMINIENEMISNDNDFYEKVINMFCERKDRCLNFKYKVK